MFLVLQHSKILDEFLFEANKDIENEEIILLIILDIIKILNIYWIDYSSLVLYYIFNCY